MRDDLHELGLRIARAMARRGGFDEREFDGIAWAAVEEAKSKPPNRFPLEQTVTVTVRSRVMDEIRRLIPEPRRQRGKVKIKHGYDFDDLLHQPATQEDAFSEKEERSMVRRLFDGMLERLPPRESFVIGRILQGQKLKAIARTLGVTEPRVSQLKLRAIERIKAWYHRPRLLP